MHVNAGFNAFYSTECCADFFFELTAKFSEVVLESGESRLIEAFRAIADCTVAKKNMLHSPRARRRARWTRAVVWVADQTESLLLKSGRFQLLRDLVDQGEIPAAKTAFRDYFIARGTERVATKERGGDGFVNRIKVKIEVRPIRRSLRTMRHPASHTVGRFPAWRNARCGTARGAGRARWRRVNR